MANSKFTKIYIGGLTMWNSIYPDDIALGISKLSNNKNIIYNKTSKGNMEKDLIYLTLFRFLGIFTRKKIIYINANFKSDVDKS